MTVLVLQNLQVHRVKVLQCNRVTDRSSFFLRTGPPATLSRTRTIGTWQRNNYACQEPEGEPILRDVRA